MLWGYPFETLYMYALIGCLVLTLLLFLFSGVFDAFDGPLDPVVVVPWLAFISLFGYIGEAYTSFGSGLILGIAVVIASILVFLLNYYVILPMKKADATISVSEKEIEGRTATVITPIPEHGMGEIAIESVTGRMNRPATLYEPGEGIPAGAKVLIIEIKERVAYVTVYRDVF
ncbi:NfeD family protein [Isobaculum melis]|uniref:Membrane protein implicated in regulation of membrane protease activity n=1 Tax=Isobaculum melis TaxID=142588 RepID=A0A1H9SQP6_9LACT|nr:NfeD family protein [Isobaculum melis]SER87135.1 Membrane protein implicated in regulation of membrane protease activity [Isobaculum melis]